MPKLTSLLQRICYAALPTSAEGVALSDLPHVRAAMEQEAAEAAAAAGEAAADERLEAAMDAALELALQDGEEQGQEQEEHQQEEQGAAAAADPDNFSAIDPRRPRSELPAAFARLTECTVQVCI